MEQTHSEKYIALGLNIAFYRKKKGLTQEMLAERVGVSRTHLSNIEATKVEKSLSLEVLSHLLALHKQKAPENQGL